MIARGPQRLLWEAKSRAARLPGLYPAFRWATKQLGDQRVYRIHWGPMKGFRWRRHNNVSYWYHRGLYEPHVSALLQAHLRPGDNYWDVGAKAGYHALLAARIAGPAGKVVAFEPDPLACDIIEDELALNDLRCIVEQAAVTDHVGRVTLRRHPNCLMSTLDGIIQEGETLEVEATTLDEMVARHGVPHLIKMDIEGAEKYALPGGEALFSLPDRPRLLLSVHGDEVAAFCRQFLHDHGYDFREQSGFEQMLVAVPRPD